ncbi:hypothetical protein [Persicirhabdus sediminis]|uniref:Uncharacterized protein n=1 Tax=Persicirhabdus sediminis TaxID=454144 RepID=A0A8J7MF68_9BACT|nr:hypothetical protein [Persicirhabdus sediminis]MBK1791573.1 hypothetical protein [Persicirhabdus sediminis]
MKKELYVLALFAGMATGVYAEEGQPTGSLWVNGSSSNSVVNENEHVSLSWEISYTITEDPGAVITAKDELVPAEKSTMEVWPIGSAYWNGNLNINLKCRVDGQEFNLYSGKSKNFKPSGNSALFTREVDENDVINFGMMGESRESGQYFRWTGTSRTEPAHSFIALKNGDTYPSASPMGSGGDVEAFLMPYFDEGTRTVVLGPKDVIFVVELDRVYTYEQSGNASDKGYDMQDMVFLVTFR